MARNSNELDKKMIAAGIELIQKGGIASLSTREIADRAGANLGMFTYHFATKENFILRLLSNIYQGFLKDLEGQKGEELDLESVLFRVAVFSRDNRKLLTAIFSDVLANNKLVFKFLKIHFSAHFVLLEQALIKHLQIKKLATPNLNHALRFLLGAAGVPNILLEVCERSSRKKSPSEDDEVLKSRVKAAIMGLEYGLCTRIK